jgi:hypothetical protein
MTEESSAYISEASSVMAQSSCGVTGADSVKEDLSCPDIEQPLEQTDKDGHYSDEKEKKKLEKNGGLRPGRKWPQYLAANLGTGFFYLSYVCSSSRPFTEFYNMKYVS